MRCEMCYRNTSLYKVVDRILALPDALEINVFMYVYLCTICVCSVYMCARVTCHVQYYRHHYLFIYRCTFSSIIPRQKIQHRTHFSFITAWIHTKTFGHLVSQQLLKCNGDTFDRVGCTDSTTACFDGIIKRRAPSAKPTFFPTFYFRIHRPHNFPSVCWQLTRLATDGQQQFLVREHCFLTQLPLCFLQFAVPTKMQHIGFEQPNRTIIPSVHSWCIRDIVATTIMQPSLLVIAGHGLAF
jgi:hypothetical protein